MLMFYSFFIAGCKEKVEPKEIEVDGIINKVEIADTIFKDKYSKIEIFYFLLCFENFKSLEKKLSDSSTSYKVFMNKTVNNQDVCLDIIPSKSFLDSIMPKKLGPYKIIVNDTHLIKTVVVK